MDLFFTEEVAFNAADINRLKIKANGGSRLVICYLSIGEAEDYRYYWQPGWDTGSLRGWIEKIPIGKEITGLSIGQLNGRRSIFGNDSSYLKKILDAGFNGAYLDIIEAFEYFE
jgi:cysteinyl-tRNA synthetase